MELFQSSFELTGYITMLEYYFTVYAYSVSKLFRAYGLYNDVFVNALANTKVFQSSFELTGYITK